MPDKKERPFDSRRYQGQVERELIVGGIAITVLVGGGLIALIWGGTAFATAMACFALFAGLIAVIWVFLKVAELVSRN